MSELSREQVESPYDGKPLLAIIEDYALVRGDLSEPYAREQLAHVALRSAEAAAMLDQARAEAVRDVEQSRLQLALVIAGWWDAIPEDARDHLCDIRDALAHYAPADVTGCLAESDET